MPYNRPIPEKKDRGWLGLSLDTAVQAEKMIQIALILPCAALIGWLLGGWLDGRFHTTWIAVAGVAFGGIAGIVGAVRMALVAGRDVKVEDTPTPEELRNRKDDTQP